MKKQIITALFLIMLPLLLLSACGNALDDAVKLKELDFDTDKVPTINAVLGEERKVRNVDEGTNNGAPYKQYTYESDSVSQDLSQYGKYLRDNGWLVVESYNFEEIPGKGALATESADSGKLLYMSIGFDEGVYAIKVTKIEGELTSDE
jgi:hypothetical protein